MTLEFRVLGVAQQMGSKSAFIPKGWSRPIITDQNAKPLRAWKTRVADAASEALQKLPAAERGLLLDGVRLTVVFALPRPKSLPKRVTANVRAPDLDKIVRGLADALTQIAYRNDNQICELIAQKTYARVGEPAHVDVKVEPSAGVQPVAMDLPLFGTRKG